MAFSFLLLLLLLLLATGRLLTLPEDLLEGTYLGKEHVTESSPQVPVGSVIDDPEMEGEELVRFCLEGLKINQVVDDLLNVPGDRCSQLDLDRFFTTDTVGDAEFFQSEIIRCVGPDVHLFQCRDTSIPGGCQFQCGGLVLQRVDHKLGWLLVGPAAVIAKMESIPFRGDQRGVDGIGGLVRVAQFQGKFLS